MTAPLENLSKLYRGKGYPGIAEGLQRMADLGKRMGMPEEFPDATVVIRSNKKLSWEERRRRSDAVNTGLEELGVSIRTRNTLARAITSSAGETPLAGVRNASDLSRVRDSDLLEEFGFGSKALDEVRQHFPYQPPEVQVFPPQSK